jgi:murein DD-endopeptidase MepM/ murein hydrolase activator NlpD
MKQKNSSTQTTIWGRKIWILNILLITTYVLIQTPSHLWLMSISQGAQAKPFTGAMMPLAFVPDWRKSDYIDQRGTLEYASVKQSDLVPLPRIEDIKSDFNSSFTYLTMFRGKYMDEDRTPGAGSHDGVDIRAPIGTPVFDIANGKVVKVVDEADNKYITIEHRDVKYG